MKAVALMIALVGILSSSFGQSYDINSGVSLNVGDKAPKISSTTPFGDKIKLSQLKGKIVLIDFWASWCGPCRRENPNVVQAYERFKDKEFESGNGFEVFSVSLDRDEVDWHKAITKDNLSWDAHAWDRNGEIRKMYGVSSIPTAFLIDGKGTIIALGNALRGDGLTEKLEELLK